MLTNLFRGRRLRIGHLHHGTTGEFNRESQTARTQQENRDQERNERDRIEDLVKAHEVNRAPNSKKLHTSLLPSPQVSKFDQHAAS